MADLNGDALRLQMINSQLRTSDVNEQDILEAFAAVPREAFVAPAQKGLAYCDGEIASAGPAGRRLLSPRTLGLLLKCAAPQPGERALVVGGGAGYCAALLAHMGLVVVDLETGAAGPAASIAVARVSGPLDKPPAGQAPFDVIVINGAFAVAPEVLIDALNDGGRLVGVDARAGAKHIVIYERAGEGVSERAAYDATADVLPGFARAPAFVF
jgi:protein-L-isoaspartate(D-aspartate) O-methyltransferase